tara:strand:- start:167 stop:877 length:711 start_codon:yes stop_codon:yes gene_type:complete
MSGPTSDPSQPSFQTPAQGVLFDLDGTLIDSAPDLVGACNDMLNVLGRSPVAFETARSWIGNGARRLVERALTQDFDGEAPAELMETAYPLFQKCYQATLNRDSVLYAGAAKTLARCQAAGRRVGCVTNKPGAFTRPLLKAMELSRYLDPIVSGDDLLRKKPDPLPLEHVAEQWGLAPAECLLVGDSVSDFRAARACGMPVVLVTYGYSQGRDLFELGPDAVIDSLSQVLNIIDAA